MLQAVSRRISSATVATLLVGAALGAGGQAVVAGSPAQTCHIAAGQSCLVVADLSPSPSASPSGTGAASPTPSPSVSPGATPVPTAAPTPTAPPPPTPAAFTTVQAAINAAPAGSSLTIPAGTYHERVTVTKALTLAMAGVTIDGTGLGVPLQQGVFSIQASNVTVSGVRADNSSGAGIDISNGAQNVTLTACRADDNRQEGFHIAGVTNVLVHGCSFDHNDVNRATYSGGEQGGGKFSNSTGVTFDGNVVFANGGPGLWGDIYDRASTYTNNVLHDNFGAGIMHEASYDALIAGNVAWHNGGPAAWHWSCNILVSSSGASAGGTGVLVQNNVVAWAYGGISIIGQSRAGDYPNIKPYRLIVATGNIIITNPGSPGSLSWSSPDIATYPTSNLLGAGYGNAASGNSYYPSRLSSDAMPTETGITILTASQVAAILAQYGIPSS